MSIENAVDVEKEMKEYIYFFMLKFPGFSHELSLHS